MALALPQLIEPVYAECLAEFKEYGTEVEMSPFQCIALVGWSNSLGEMCGQYQLRHPGENSFRPREAIDSIMHPNVVETDAPEHALDTADGMEAQARYQCAWGRANYPKWAIGGWLVVAELRRNSMSMTSRSMA